ncbi:MAG: metal-dependent transcriptional regulator [Actinobacteria bacterium]|nr:MAG: metal-dependent transcriptional regulator [Actinomycetota bacterium]
MSNPESHGVEDYLEAIYELQEEGERVVQARISRRLGVTRASVSEQVARLQKMRLVESNARAITLTPHGFAVAEDAVRKHRLAERFLTDVLKMPWHLAHQEANRFQSGITAEIEGRMLSVLGEPATCPHGNPIPGTGATIDPTLQPLKDFVAGETVELVRLLEDVELDTDAMRYFEEHALVPGARITIVDVGPDGTMSLAVGDTKSSLGPKLTDNLWVRPAIRKARAK